MKKNILALNQSGMAMMIAVIVVIMVTMISGAFMNMAYQLQRNMYANSGGRTYAYYRALAGIADAQWRLRKNINTGLPASSPASAKFNSVTYGPTYYIDIGLGLGGAAQSYTPGAVKVTISRPAGSVATGVRTITVFATESDTNNKPGSFNQHLPSDEFFQ